MTLKGEDHSLTVCLTFYPTCAKTPIEVYRKDLISALLINMQHSPTNTAPHPLHQPQHEIWALYVKRNVEMSLRVAHAVKMLRLKAQNEPAMFRLPHCEVWMGGTTTGPSLTGK